MSQQLQLKDLIIGSHIYFAREGAVVGGVTVTDAAKPTATPADNWHKFGTVEQFEPKKQVTWAERRAPTPGKYQTRRRFPLKSQLMLNFSVQEWDRMGLAELLLNANKPDTAGLFVPNSRGDELRGWLKLQCYDQTDTLIFALDVWVSLDIEGYQFGEKLDPYALKAEVLYSPLNSGQIAALDAATPAN